MTGLTVTDRAHRLGLAPARVDVSGAGGRGEEARQEDQGEGETLTLQRE